MTFGFPGACYGLSCLPLKRYTEVPVTSCKLIWKEDLYRYNHVKMRSAEWTLIQ